MVENAHFLLIHKYHACCKYIKYVNMYCIVGVVTLLDPKICMSGFILARLPSQQSAIVCFSGLTFNCSFIRSTPGRTVACSVLGYLKVERAKGRICKLSPLSIIESFLHCPIFCSLLFTVSGCCKRNFSSKHTDCHGVPLLLSVLDVLLPL